MLKLADIGLAELQVFEAIYRCRSVVEASRVLDLPQPTVSRWLAKLRDHFGDALFVRTPRGMEPTEAADAIIGPVRDMLRIYRDRLMQERAFDPRSTSRNFRIAASDFGQLTVLPILDRWSAEEAPKARFSSVAVDRQTLAAGLESGDIDIAFGGFPALYSGVIEQTLYEDSYVCAMRRGHPLLDRPFTVEAFRDATHVLVSARTAGHIHHEVEARIMALVSPENVRLTSNSFLVAPLLIGQTDMVLTVPRRVALIFKSQIDLEMVPLPFDLPRFQVKQYWHERSKHDPGHQWLRHGVADLLARRASLAGSSE
ncbi:LysR family transcriptional regulator [Sphingobium chlorophenolicum]|uniref:LysR-family transcriptional regulator n=1 Tax=Sphingobium chlorophenolicum TaxID=46429 RepID=A0A081RA95_SPHCR|nr:LysR family transcriptional regulator [Sphingobium chlorophenolicum]KEQ52118.1 LysR-family transcriptional regulator [Sphingobium chlorophenolicum]